MSKPQDEAIKILQDENASLRHSVEELAILNDLARLIGASSNSEDIMQTIVSKSLHALHAEQGVIAMIDSSLGQSFITLVRGMGTSTRHPKYHLNQDLVGWMELNKQPLTLHDPTSDSRFSGAAWDSTIRNVLSVPMMIKSKLTGVLTVYNKKDGLPFTPDDQRLLAIIGSQSAQIVENARLYEHEKALARVQEEIRLASKIQTDLLPKGPPALQGYDIAGRSLPAQTVGGDYFDFIPVDDHRLAVTVGDVSGKGLPAALLMANLQATLRGQTLSVNSPRDCIIRANRLLYDSTASDKFVTLFYAIIDSRNSSMSSVNAGHNPPLLLTSEGVQRLNTGGLVLSYFPDAAFDEQTIDLQSEDVLVIYSDGVTESFDANEQEFGEDRLQKIVQDHRHERASSLLDEILKAVHRHAGSVPQSDDITVVVVKKK